MGTNGMIYIQFNWFISQIVEYGGLRLLVPLTESSDPEVQRLAAHALANLSVDGRYECDIFMKLIDLIVLEAV